MTQPSQSVRPLVSLGDLIDLLSCPTRREIIAVVSRGPIAVTALAKHTGIDITHVSRYLAMFANAGMVSSRKVGRQHIYGLGRAAMATTRADGGASIIFKINKVDSLQIDLCQDSIAALCRPIDSVPDKTATPDTVA